MAMKRPCEEAAQAMPAPIVKLNVGGTPFDTTRDSLAKCRYFEPLLEGRFRHAAEDQGRFFIDRDGSLFAHLLNHMRTSQRPTQKIVRDTKDQLLAECDFFGYDAFAKSLRGEVSEYDMRFQERSIREEEATLRDEPAHHREGFLLDPFAANSSQRQRPELELPLLLASKEAPVLRDGYAEFRERLDDFSGGLLDALKAIPGLVIAGGAVVGALTDTDKGDLDIFLTLPPDEADKSLRKVFAVIQENQAAGTGSVKSRLLITRSNAALTMYRVRGGKPDVEAPPVQVILTTYTSVLDILVGFDVDCCAFAWVAAEEKVVCTPRALAALRYGVNIADSQFDGMGYCRRLEKYAARGWAVAVPGLDKARVRPELLAANYVFLKSWDLLLRVQPRGVGRKGMCIETMQMNDGGCLSTQRTNITASSVQAGASVRGFPRMVVLDQSDNVQGALVPTVWFCEKHPGGTAPLLTATCLPLVCENGHYVLLWGADADESEDEEDDTGGVSETPRASVYALLEQHFASELESGTDETPQNSDAMYPGGAMEQCRTSMRGSKSGTYNKLRATMVSRLVKRRPLLYVYDLCSCRTEFDQLRFVVDAARPPLRAAVADFKSAYGLSQKLEFTRRSRARYASDWWASVY
jgi:hypothetical protein